MADSLDAIIALAGAIFGTIVGFIGTYYSTMRQHKNNLLEDSLRVQQERIDLQRNDFQTFLSLYADRIDKYISERRALILALTEPLHAPQTVVHNLYPDIWRTASVAHEVAIIAESFGSLELASDLKEFEQVFRELWKIKSGQQEGTDLKVDELEKRASDLYARMVKSVIELRAKISQIRGIGTGRFDVRNLPKLMEAPEAENSSNNSQMTTQTE